MKGYTCTDAVKDVLKEWAEGEELKGYEIHKRVLRKMREHGSVKRPLDSSVLRHVRSFGPIYKVGVVHNNQSVYKKY